MKNRTETIPSFRLTPAQSAFIDSLTNAQVRQLHKLECLNFRTWGDRRKPETLRHGLRVYVTNFGDRTIEQAKRYLRITA